MYVPPEAVPDYGEVRMTLDESGVETVTHTGHDPTRVAAAVNPIYTGSVFYCQASTLHTTNTCINPDTHSHRTHPHTINDLHTTHTHKP